MRAAGAAALLLVFQALVSAFAAGAAAAPADIFGNPLCVTGGGQSAPQHGGGHGNLPECCTLGCPMASGGAAPPPEAAAFRAPPLVSSSPGLFRSAPSGIAGGRSFGPGSPRGPPLSR